ncbi:hypothetical protein CaCOL14_007976 [Colletotrichum acutatum]|uniref:HAUS augmin-like complex subunit 6 N-terminus-domain-containing protein n=1 Tax=Glomerella acutata TaxID=27357 RepID=A0AAD8XG43_GLOAC|nr:HAUS augmin-like complex subunit 6 N-terminus-domain-containing protein [Colletotrichum acutatum]KAK1723523.1 HAUS augmin-like complex subunit 6 N-terminus-domain-containing protein [Colletotrichum acutatum]
MATLPANSLLARSRQPRPGPSTKTLSAPLNASISPSIAPTTNASLFLTNLRLLDFPSFSDWPDFDAQTFSVQKKRIHCVEWTLYQLFVLWDPEEARNKLQPFFPPRDHVQSMNLRAALLRSLDQAKKNGVLGRDAVVRKTMLDECKGERLEEVLAVFSSAVLKKMVAEVAEAEHEYPAIAQQVALENRGYSAERTELVTLALAHRASITNAMRKKNEARKRYRDLAEVLSQKEKGIARRKEEIKSARELTSARNLPDNLRSDTWRTLRTNWAGNEKWMETLLYGDSNARKDGLLSAPFDRVWRRLESGRLTELETHDTGLLEQLDDRVRTQRERLARWQEFRADMFGERRKASTSKTSQPTRTKRGIDLEFDSHESLHLGRTSPKRQLAKKSTSLTRKYSNLLDDCLAELAEVGSLPVVKLTETLGPRTRHHEKPDGILATRESLGDETISELSELEDDLHGTNNLPRRPSLQEPHLRRLERPAINISSRTSSSDLPAPLPSPLLLPPESPDELAIPPPTPPLPDEDDITETVPNRIATPPLGEEGEAEVPFGREESSPEPPKSPTQELADQILKDMDVTSPSPVKRSKPRHTLSLSERTRLSMARSSRSVKYDPDDEEDDTLTLRPSFASANRRTGEVTIRVTDEGDLVARTRKSMVRFEAAHQKAQLDRQKSLKKSRPRARTESQIPVVEEETMGLDPDASILAEELMAVEDMEAVFRSRPRIKTSPAPSPSRKPLEKSL